MSNSRIIDAVCMIIIVLGIAVTILFINGEKLGIEVMKQEGTEKGTEEQNQVADKPDYDDSLAKATEIALNGKTGTVKGTGAYFYDGDLIIGQSGEYILSGIFPEGCIKVDAGKKAKVQIVLNGVSVSCNDGPSILVEKADNVTLTLVKDKENIISCGEEFSKKSKKEKYEGAICSKKELTINGEGSLEINGYGKHGIDCKDDLIISGGNISVNARKDAIHVKKDVSFSGAALTVNTGDDGITAGGSITINDGVINAEDCYEGMEGSIINVYGGKIYINTRDDGMNAREEGGDLSPDCSINIAGGDITIVNSDASDADGLDSNGDIVITGGRLFISLPNKGTNNAIDYGSECGGICTISGGTVIACGSYAMAEGFDKTSMQPSVLYGYSKGAKDETVVVLKDSMGNVLLSEQIPNSFSAITFSTPDLKLGSTYEFFIGEYGTEIAINEMAASYGDVKSEKMPGPFNKGDMKHFDGSGEGFNGPHGRGPEGPMDSGMENQDFDKDFKHGKPGKIERPEIPADIQAIRDEYKSNMEAVRAASENQITEEEYEDPELYEDERIDISDVSDETWYSIFTAFGVIIMGIMVAAVFKRRQ